MAYQVLRVEKLKSLASVRRSLKHAFRTQETPNADPSRASLNQYFGAESDKEAMAKIKNLMPAKLRKNGVVCVEHLVTASPEWFTGKSVKEQNDFFNDSLQWLRERWGSENVVSGGVHRDEKTPHMYVYIVPKDHETGRLNCRKWLGERDALSNMQSIFHEDVSKKYGMERGLKGSKAKHQTIKKYYEKLNSVEMLEYDKPTRLELTQQALGKDNRINHIFKQAALIPVLKNENRLIQEAHQDERLRLIKINELSKKSNLDLKERFKYPIEVVNKYLEKAEAAKSAITAMDSINSENEALKIALRSSELKVLSYQNIINENNNEDQNCETSDPSPSPNF
ncbi:MobV family relaxase [Pseudoalteromonas sp. CAL260-MNA-CIBAN-0059]|uniref:MobV family relaxase n=1 Tax=Pseudoalteromonas sp. CAL260-MNA-CIBAN-0059 TaxID=3140430 RepID=UPI003318EBE8